VATLSRFWDHQPCDEAAASALAASAGVGLVTARLLCQRGITEEGDAARFLRPSLDHLHDPFRLTDMAPAVDRVLAAI
jgi:single-stranded-DNA-specific exonuclease